MSHIERLQLSHSSLKVLNSCPRKLQFNKFYNAQLANTESLPANVGTALHAAMQNYYQFKDKERAIWALMHKYPYHFKESAMGGRSLYAAYAVLQQLMLADTGALELAYFKDAQGEDHPCVELCFQLDIVNFSLSDSENVPVSYIGYIDLVMQNTLTGELLVYDIKTHRKNIEGLEVEYMFDEQCIPYALVVQHLLNKQLTSLQVNYLACYIDTLAPLVQTYPFMKTESDIKDWAQGFVKSLYDIKFYYTNNWFPRRGGSSCTAYGNACKYASICQYRDDNIVQALLDENAASDFRRKVHTPNITLELDLSLYTDWS